MAIFNPSKSHDAKDLFERKLPVVDAMFDAGRVGASAQTSHDASLGHPSPASARPFDGMYDSPAQGKEKDPQDVTDKTATKPADPAKAQPAKTRSPEDEEKEKNVAVIQGYIDESKKLETDAAKLEASGDKAGAQAKRNEAAGKKQSAVDKAITTYKIDTSNAQSVKYDHGTSGEGLTGPTADGKKGIVTIGDAAFSSPQWLASSIGHESEGHINKQLMKGNWYTGAIGTDIQEVEAYQYELDNAKRYGTSDADVKRLQQRRESHYNALTRITKKKSTRVTTS